jgi:DeoR/GlpR family transcriptional regulator of sugar metabolism
MLDTDAQVPLPEPTAPASHPHPEAMVAFVLGTLSFDEEDVVQAHIDQCDECTERVYGMFHSVEQLDTDSCSALANRMMSAVDRISSGREPHIHSQEISQTMQGQSNAVAKAVKSWANMQKESDTERKELVAEWVCRQFRPKSESGIYFDAGSACLSVFQRLARLIVSEGSPSQINVVTNNLMILNEFANDPSPILYGTKLSSVGEALDVFHQAFFGPGIKKRLEEGTFRPELIFIGTNAISFGEEGSVLFGFHADDPEREVKELLFENPCKAKARVILATAKKIGTTGGTVFDILKVPNLDRKSPLYLLSTKPSDQEREGYDEAIRIFRSEAVQRAISGMGLQFKWFEIQGPDSYVDLSSLVLSDGLEAKRDLYRP